MYLPRIVILFIGLMVLTGAASAMTISTDKPWIVANGTDSSVISVQILNYNNEPMRVDYAILPSSTATGSLSSASVPVDLTGQAATTYRVGTKSGVVNIQASAYFTNNGTLYQSSVVTQKVDHGTPVRISQVIYETQVEVGRTTNILVRMADANDNIVDNLRETDEGRTAEKIRYIAGSINGGAYFITPGVVTMDGYVNQTGCSLAPLTIDTMAGANWVRIEPQTPLPTFTITIAGIGSMPVSIAQLFSPDGSPFPHCPADGMSRFTLLYSLTDRWGNPAANRTINITTSLGEHAMVGPTNEFGQAMMMYGPKFTIGFATINATVVDNTSVKCTKTVEFTAMAAESMQLTASSTTMASLDVNPDTRSLIRARVVDMDGNPVANEVVNFIITPPTGTYTPYVQTAPPYLENPGQAAASAITNAAGYAIVVFAPGTFTVNQSEPGYATTATGSVRLVATWNTTVRDIMLTYKNYPYLRVETEVTNTTIEAGSDLDVTIRLIGDGHNLSYRRPVDAVLAPSRSGTMMKQDRDMMLNAFEGEHAFIDVLKERQAQGGFDAVGILTYGENAGGVADILALPSQDKKYAGRDNSAGDDAVFVTMNYPYNNIQEYHDYTTVEKTLTDDLFAVEAAINNTVPWGDVTSGHITPFRRALYDGVNLVAPGANSLKAVIILIDNTWSYYGDPLARGLATTDITINEGNRYYPFPGLGSGEFSNQNMSIYAQNHNVRYYVVYVADHENSNDRVCLQNLAGSTGGTYNYTANPESLKDIYSWIANQLVTEAAVNATMGLEMVAFDNTTNMTISAGDIFDYVHLHNAPINSTDVYLYKWAGNDPYTPVSTVNRTCEDDTEDYYTNNPPDNQMYSLYFNVGTIHIKETWQTMFRLHVKDTINHTLQFRLFGPDSIIRFDNDPVGTLNLYNSSPLLTVVPHMNVSAFNGSSIRIESPPGVVNINNASFIEFLDFQWYVTYTGEFSYNETVSYQYQDPLTGVWGPKIRFDALGPKSKGDYIPGGTDSRPVLLDIRTFPHGLYRIWVDVTAEDGPSDEAYIDLATWQTKNYIVLE